MTKFKKILTLYMISLALLSIVNLLQFPTFAASTSKVVVANEYDVYENNTPINIEVVKNGSELYLNLNDVADLLHYRIFWLPKYKGYIIIDYENRLISCNKDECDYVHVSKYKKDYMVDGTAIDYELDNEKNVKLKEAIINVDNKNYISIKMLSSIMYVNVGVSENKIEISHNTSPYSFDEYFKNEQDLYSLWYDDLEYFKGMINLKEKYFPGDFKGIRDLQEISYYNTLINKSFWYSNRVIKNRDLITQSTGKPYTGKLSLFSKVTYLGVDINKRSLIASLNGKGKYLISYENFGSYVESSDRYSLAFSLTDPMKKIKWNQNTWEKIEKCDYWIGMTPEMAVITMGYPNDVNRSVGSWGTSEQWVYDYGNYNFVYLYFVNGQLTSWQD